jgi:arylsulfatase A-like enzyme
VPPGWTDWRGALDGFDGGGTYRYFDTTLNINGVPVGNGGRYQTRLFGDHSTRIVDEYARSNQPFFLWASYVAPHSGGPREQDDPQPVVRKDGKTQTFKTPARPGNVRGTMDRRVEAAPEPKGEADVSDKPFFIRRLPAASATERDAMLEVTRQRAEALAVLDEQVARTVRALRRSGELDNTIVMVTSDNGYMHGEHRMRQGKILPYEPSLRVPLLVRGPGIPRHEIRNDPFSTIDLAPTFLAAARAPQQRQVDGTNLLSVARRGDRGWTRGILTDTGPRRVASNAEESDNWLMEGRGSKVKRFSQGVRTSGYLYVEHASREKELYDMRSDPEQLHNLAGRADLAPIQRSLAGVLDRLRNCKGDKCAAPLPASLQSR